jgi:triphosphoribosyl-dephospho-CoA synthetase
MVAWYAAIMGPQAMTIRMPEDLYEQLRRAAFEARVPMNTLINEGIELKLAELKAAAAKEVQS